RDGDARRVSGVRQHRVDRLAAETRGPFGTMRVLPQRADDAVVLAAVLGTEQGAGLGAGPDDAWLRRRGRDLPQALECGVGALGEPDGAFLRLDPRLAEIVAVEHRRAPVLARRRHEDARPAGAGVDCDGVHAVHGEGEVGQLPGCAIGAAGEEQPLRRADRQEDFAHARSLSLPSGWFQGLPRNPRSATLYALAGTGRGMATTVDSSRGRVALAGVLLTGCAVAVALGVYGREHKSRLPVFVVG